MIDSLLHRLRTWTGLRIQPDWRTSELRTATFLHASLLTVLLVLAGAMACSLALGETTLLPVALVQIGGLVGALWLNTRGRRYLSAVALCAQALVFLPIYALALGWGSHVSTTFGLVLLAQFFLFTREEWRTTATVAFLVSLSFVLTWVHHALDLSFPFRASTQVIQMQQDSSVVVLVVQLGLFGAYAWATLTAQERQLEAQQNRIEGLLLNVLPEAIARRLEAGEEPIADQFDEVSVLFADVVGFTPMSATMSPSASVAVLNEVFTAFDAICQRYGVEKIRTIGDGYMCCSGAPEPREDHADVLARVALEMRQWLEDSDTPLEIRIGLNSGEAVGGVIGRTKFHYDLWGDAVNVAARMESHGSPGRIHLGAGTANRLSAGFTRTARGEVEIKGKGPMQTWWLDAPPPDAA